MTQKKFSSIAFVFLLLISAFILGYLAGENKRTADVHMTQISEASKVHSTEKSISTSESVDTEEEAETNGLIDINTADQALLETLPGIGAALAGRIIEYCDTVGGFTSKEQIQQVSGIGQKKYADIEALITVGGQP